LSDDLKLLVEWSSPWEEFVGAIRPALGKSPAELAGEAHTGLFPYRGILITWGAEFLILIALIVLPTRLQQIQPYAAPTMPKYDVIYFSGNELPQVEDQGGARSGHSGKAGGHEGHHRTQTIRVARGDALRERVVDAPKLNLPRSNADVANLLAYKPIPGPAPAEGLKSSRAALSLNQTVIAPAPQVTAERMRTAPSVNTSVIAPTQTSPLRDIAALRLPGSHAEAVIPPPVSAPEQLSVSNPKLALPAPTIIAPPPAQVPHDIASTGPGFGPGDLHSQIIPPPAQVSGITNSRQFGGLAGNSSVVPPPVDVGGGSLQRSPMTGMGNGTAVVPPPPSVSAGGGLGGRGSGNRGAGFGSSFDVGTSVTAPANSGGSGNGTGVVVSGQPGSQVGVPGTGGNGALALSPAGSGKPGLGGSGGGTGIGRGTGTGSGLTGEGTGAGTTGTGVGAEASARGGTSPYPGPGGAGSGTNGKPAMPGVSVHGGSNIVTLPSFGSNGGPQALPGRSGANGDKHGPGLTVVATSRSGGAFNFYGVLKGDRVYTVYIETALGTAVMQYADPASASHPYAEDLQAPEPLRADLPPNLSRSRLVIACLLDRSGILRNLQVLESGAGDLSAKVLGALANWKFRPVLRGDQPVEVNAILGFNIDTR
jgi:hypothetical protein